MPSIQRDSIYNNATNAINTPGYGVYLEHFSQNKLIA
jgi:hypothetical protein